MVEMSLWWRAKRSAPQLGIAHRGGKGHGSSPDLNARRITLGRRAERRKDRNPPLMAIHQQIDFRIDIVNRIDDIIGSFSACATADEVVGVLFAEEFDAGVYFYPGGDRGKVVGAGDDFGGAYLGEGGGGVALWSGPERGGFSSVFEGEWQGRRRTRTFNELNET